MIPLILKSLPAYIDTKNEGGPKGTGTVDAAPGRNPDSAPRLPTNLYRLAINMGTWKKPLRRLPETA